MDHKAFISQPGVFEISSSFVDDAYHFPLTSPAGHYFLRSHAWDYQCSVTGSQTDRKKDLILILTPEKQGKTLGLSKHWSGDSTPARNEVIMKTTYPVKSVKCDKICSNY